MRKLISCTAISFFSLAALAEPQTVTLDVPGMNCAMCPITVKKALDKVEGVTQVEVSYENKQALVTFDNAKVSADKLVSATTNAGYPSSVHEEVRQ